MKKYVAKVLAGEAIVQVLAWPSAHIAEKLAERWEAYGATVIPEAEWKKDPTRAKELLQKSGSANVFFYLGFFYY